MRRARELEDLLLVDRGGVDPERGGEFGYPGVERVSSSVLCFFGALALRVVWALCRSCMSLPSFGRFP
jgi:hypothetical protein